MGCFYPLAATQLLNGTILVHKRTPGIDLKPTPAGFGRDIKLPCGRCIGCKIQRTQDWATRCLHESQQHKENCFLTLTYRPDLLHPSSKEPDLSTVGTVDNREDARELPTIAQDRVTQATRNSAHVDNSRSRPPSAPASLGRKDRSASCLTPDWDGEGLSKKDHKKFVKRLRKKCGPLRYYMCGEYGEKLGKPHYHYLIFGYNFPDRYYWKTSKSGERIYRSATLDRLWPFGHAWIGSVTYESCAYVAAYVMKKLNGSKAEEHYRRQDEGGNDYWLMPEFNEMSRRPGIANKWWHEFNADVYTDDVIIRDARKARPPRYYDKLLKLFDPAAMAVIQMKREARARDLDEDNTPARLADKEAVALARLKLKKRELETL